MVGNIDTTIATMFIEESLANSADPEQEPLEVTFLFAFQKARVEKQTIEIMERFNSKMLDLKQRIQKPIPETELANEIYAIKNAATLHMQSLFKYTTQLEPNENLDSNI